MSAGPGVLDREGPGRVADPAHQRRGRDAVPGDVAEDDDELPAVDHERVVPVAADLDAALGRVVRRGDCDAGHRRERLRQDAALQHRDQPVLRGQAFFGFA